MFFEIQTSHGTRLMHKLPSGRIETRSVAGMREAESLVLLYVPQHHAQICFMLSAHDSFTNLVMWGEPAEDWLLPFRLTRLPHEHKTALAHPLSGLHVCAGPPENHLGQASVVVNRPAVSSWETFDLVAPSAPVCGPALALAAAIERILSYGSNMPGLLMAARAETSAGTFPAIRAIYSVLTHDEAVWFARELLTDRQLVARWGNLLPEDPWLRHALPLLQDWLSRGRPPMPARQILPVSLDFLDSVAGDGRYNSFGFQINAAARRTVQPSKTLCIVASARNEGIYLLEWIAYHRLLGVKQFFLYSNNNDDRSDLLLAALADAGEIVWLDNQVALGRRAQTKAYAHAFSMLPGLLDYRWALVIDLDEFLVLDRTRFGSLIEYLEWQEINPVDVIKFNWLVFGSSGQHAWQDRPITERFTRRLPYVDPHVKSMVRANRCIHSQPHYPLLDPRDRPIIRNGSGLGFAAGDGPSFAASPEDGIAWINHYFLKSAEEFLWKFSRNRGDEFLRDCAPGELSDEFIDMFMAQHSSASMVEDPRAALDMGRIRLEIARLETLPRVTDARSQVVASFRERLTDIKAALRNNPGYRSDDRRSGFLAHIPD